MLTTFYSDYIFFLWLSFSFTLAPVTVSYASEKFGQIEKNEFQDHNHDGKPPLRSWGAPQDWKLLSLGGFYKG